MKKSSIEFKKLSSYEIARNSKRFVLFFTILICILGISFVKKTLQNDTFYRFYNI